MGDIIIEEFLCLLKIFFIAEDILFQRFYRELGCGLCLLLRIQALQDVKQNFNMKAKFIYFVELRIDLIIKLILVDLLRILGLKVTENYTFFLLLFFGLLDISFFIFLCNFNLLFFRRIVLCNLFNRLFMIISLLLRR